MVGQLGRGQARRWEHTQSQDAHAWAHRLFGTALEEVLPSGMETGTSEKPRHVFSAVMRNGLPEGRTESDQQPNGRERTGNTRAKNTLLDGQLGRPGEPAERQLRARLRRAGSVCGATGCRRPDGMLEVEEK